MRRELDRPALPFGSSRRRRRRRRNIRTTASSGAVRRELKPFGGPLTTVLLLRTAAPHRSMVVLVSSLEGGTVVARARRRGGCARVCFSLSVAVVGALRESAESGVSAFLLRCYTTCWPYIDERLPSVCVVVVRSSHEASRVREEESTSGRGGRNGGRIIKEKGFSKLKKTIFS